MDVKFRTSADRFVLKSKFLPESLRVILSCEKNSKSSLESLQKIEQTNEEKNKKRRWFSIVLSWITIFFALLQFSMFSSILGPFLAVLDPTVSKDFAPWTVVAYSFGQMITPPLFGFWSNKIKKCRPPIVTGLLIIIIGSTAFCCLETFPSWSRKWAMLTIRVVIGLGSGIVSVSRTYCATASTKSERAKAIAGSTATLGLSVIAGPGAQGVFALIGYPGVFIHTFHLHMYNAPAFTTILISFILLILNNVFLLEEYPGVEKRDNESNETFTFTVRALPKYDKFGAWLLVWCWFCIWTALTNFVILGVPFTQAQFDWSLSQAILYNGGIFGAFAAVSLIVYLFFAFYGSKLDDRIPTILGMVSMLAFYLFTLPWPGYKLPSNLMLTDSAFNGSGNLTMNMSLICKYANKAWCFDTPRIPVILYLASFAFLAAGFPIANSSLSSLLSKLLGPRKQGMMQGIYVTTGGFARLLGPLLITFIFTRFGPQLSWTFTIVLITTGILSAIIFRKRLVPLDAEPKLKPGEFYYYKFGVVYRL